MIGVIYVSILLYFDLKEIVTILSYNYKFTYFHSMKIFLAYGIILEIMCGGAKFGVG